MLLRVAVVVRVVVRLLLHLIIRRADRHAFGDRGTRRRRILQIHLNGEAEMRTGESVAHVHNPT